MSSVRCNLAVDVRGTYLLIVMWSHPFGGRTPGRVACCYVSRKRIIA